MPDNVYRFNGIDGRTGGYVLPSLTDRDLARAARAQSRPPQLQALLAAEEADRRVDELGDLFARQTGTRFGGAPDGGWDLDHRGWGVVFAASDARTAEIREALAPLLELRRAQATRLKERRYRELELRAGESLWDFRARYHGDAGVFDPSAIPYFLLLIGGPEAIPFEFQTQLAVSHAAGRLDFPTAAEFATYAEAVVAAETRPMHRQRRVAFFAPEHPQEPLSKESADLLAAPLARWFGAYRKDWQVDVALGDEATKAKLAGLLEGDAPPAVLFTAGHGVAFASGDPRQADDQGALLCSDWRGPSAHEISAADYFAASDLSSSACLSGMIAFHFACCSLGVPERNELHLAGVPIPDRLAPRPLLARLPQRLLASPRGGALAVLGHIDLVFASSFKDAAHGPQIYEECLRRLLAGLPVGAAMEPFRQRYAQLSVELKDMLTGEMQGGKVGDEQMARVWTSCHDAEYYAICGDPAVRLPESVTAPVTSAVKPAR